jgi:hypothetical protein
VNTVGIRWVYQAWKDLSDAVSHLDRGPLKVHIELPITTDRSTIRNSKLVCNSTGLCLNRDYKSADADCFGHPESCWIRTLRYSLRSAQSRRKHSSLVLAGQLRSFILATQSVPVNSRHTLKSEARMFNNGQASQSLPQTGESSTQPSSGSLLQQRVKPSPTIACTLCRQCKAKCITTEPSSSQCDRCRAVGCVCIRQPHQRGRKRYVLLSPSVQT